MDPGHPPADARLRAYRLTGRSGGLDSGKVPRMVGLWWRPRRGLLPGSPPGQHQPVLVHGCDRLVLLALLRPNAWSLADPSRRDRVGADRLLRVPARDPAPAPLDCGAHLHQHSALERHGARWALRGHGATGCAGARDPGVLQIPASSLTCLRSSTNLSEAANLAGSLDCRGELHTRHWSLTRRRAGKGNIAVGRLRRFLCSYC